jgi:hypothetical protein
MTLQPRGIPWLSHSLAVCFFAILACVYSYPLVLNLQTHVPGPPGDNLTFVWNFWWFRFALATGSSWFECPYLFAPFGTSLVLHTHTALQAITGATLLAPLPVVAAHNLVLLAGLAANGIATYGLAYSQVQKVMPAALAGVVFATSAYLGLHLLGHFNLVHAWVLPAAAFAWMKFSAAPKFTTAALVAVTGAASLYSDYYYFVYILLFAIVWTLASQWAVSVRFGAPRARWSERVVIGMMAVIFIVIAVILLTGGGELAIGRWRISAQGIRNPATALWLLLLVWIGLRSKVRIHRRAAASIGPLLRNVLWTIAIGAVLILPLASAAAHLLAEGDYVAPEHRWRSAPGGVDLVAFATGNPLHPIYGDATTRLFNRLGIGLIDQSAWIGLVPILVALALMKTGRPVELASRQWLAIGGFFLVWSAGPFLHVGGHGTGVLLPQFFARFVPLLSNARIPGRAFVMVVLAVAVVVASIVNQLGWRTRSIVMLIVLALVDGLVMPYPLSAVPNGGRIEQYLANDRAQGSVLAIPTGYQDGFAEIGRFDGRTVSWQTVHQRPIVGGYISRVSERIKTGYRERPVIAALISLSSAQPGPGPVALPADVAGPLAADGVRFVIVDRRLMSGLPSRADLEPRGLTLLLQENDRELYGVRQP